MTGQPSALLRWAATCTPAFRQEGPDAIAEPDVGDRRQAGGVQDGMSAAVEAEAESYWLLRVEMPVQLGSLEGAAILVLSRSAKEWRPA